MRPWRLQGPPYVPCGPNSPCKGQQPLSDLYGPRIPYQGLRPQHVTYPLPPPGYGLPPPHQGPPPPGSGPPPPCNGPPPPGQGLPPPGHASPLSKPSQLLSFQGDSGRSMHMPTGPAHPSYTTLPQHLHIKHQQQAPRPPDVPSANFYARPPLQLNHSPSLTFSSFTNHQSDNYSWQYSPRPWTPHSSYTSVSPYQQRPGGPSDHAELPRTPGYYSSSFQHSATVTHVSNIPRVPVPSALSQCYQDNRIINIPPAPSPASVTCNWNHKEGVIPPIASSHPSEWICDGDDKFQKSRCDDEDRRRKRNKTSRTRSESSNQQRRTSKERNSRSRHRSKRKKNSSKSNDGHRRNRSCSPSHSRSRSRTRSTSHSRSRSRSQSKRIRKRTSSSPHKSYHASSCRPSNSRVEGQQRIKGMSRYERKTNSPTFDANVTKPCSVIAESLESEALEDHALEKELEEEISMWIRCSPADLYYQQDMSKPGVMMGTPRLLTVHDQFEFELVQRSNRVKSAKPKYEPPNRKQKLKPPKMNISIPYSDSSSDSEDLEESSEEENNAVQELEIKKKHPDRLHEELWFNDPGEMNDGPLCRCSVKARRSGIRHGIYPGETPLPKCDPLSNNADLLHHYRITISPHTNFLTKTPTIIKHDGHEFIFEGFSMFSHYPLGKLPTCKVIRFNIEYTIHYIEEKFLENFSVRGLELFSEFLFKEILELADLDLKAHGDPDGCNQFHFMPRFARALEDNGKEILSMNELLIYLLHRSKPLVDEETLPELLKMNQYEWQNFADKFKGSIVTYPGMKPCSLRVDQLDRDQASPDKDEIAFPEIVHFGIRPLQLSYAGNPNYQKAWREYVKFRHLLANKPKVSYPDRHRLMQKEMRLQEMRTKSNMKRDVTVVVRSKGFYQTGIMCDIVQHAMLLPVLVCHLRFHKSLDIVENTICNKFEDRYLLQLALTHPSYRENFGTNPDHARNSLTNCGIRQPEYGDRRIHYMNTRKRGINTLINIMSRFGKREETMSNINHNERLEFLGDAVVEFLTSIHLFHLFPDIEEGGLATYRAAIVQNQHLAVLSKKLHLETFMLYAHGSDLCHDLELRHAMANCFEALMGALFLDGGIEAADHVFSRTLFSEDILYDVWVKYPPHPIQEQEPDGDRQWIEAVPLLKKLTSFEKSIGVDFKHIRLLARAFTHRSVGFNNLTLGSNQRLEFLGDTVLQLVASEYLYKFFPEHHEGHLSLLRSSLVNNRTQSVVCDDLGMVDYAIYAYPKGELKTKDRADLLEAFLGALYVDQGLEHCRVFCQVCFFPRLQDFIMNQDWNDPKSKLQQCCLTLRTMDGGEPDIPVYRVIESKGPTNTRIFTVAVYFRGERLAKGSGHRVVFSCIMNSIQQAEMAAASKALESSKADLFPQLNHQKRVIERSLKQQREKPRDASQIVNSDG